MCSQDFTIFYGKYIGFELRTKSRFAFFLHSKRKPQGCSTAICCVWYNFPDSYRKSIGDFHSTTIFGQFWAKFWWFNKTAILYTSAVYKTSSEYFKNLMFMEDGLMEYFMAVRKFSASRKLHWKFMRFSVQSPDWMWIRTGPDFQMYSLW